MDLHQFVGYCGVYCELCGARNTTPKKARMLLDELKDSEFEDWGLGSEENKNFWAVLNRFAEDPSDKCCKNLDCGHPWCAIRNCTKEKSLETCALCDEYPCDMIVRFSRSEPLLIHDGHRIKEIGLEAWIEEQEERKRKGFSYGIIRCGASDIPLDEPSGNDT